MEVGEEPGDGEPEPRDDGRREDEDREEAAVPSLQVGDEPARAPRSG